MIWIVAVVMAASGWALAGTAQAAGPATTITISLSSSSILADGTSQTTATVTVTDASNVGVPGDPVAVSADLGDTVGTVTNTAGTGTYTATITSSTTVGTATIKATDGALSTTAQLSQTLGPPTKVAVTLSPTSVPADGVSQTTATATVTDAGGHGLSGQTVKFSSDLGETIGAVTDAGSGKYTATVTSSTTVGTATITAADGSVSGGATLSQTKPSPATVAVTLSPGSIVADGVSTTIATATVTDAGGHPLPTETVAFSSSDTGEVIGAVANAGGGKYTVTIISSKTVGVPTIKATDGSVSGTALLVQTAGPPASVVVTLNPTSIVANGVSTTTATATVTDAEGHPLTAQPVVFSSSDLGEVISGVTNATGTNTYTVTIRSSTTVGTATITAADGLASGQAPGGLVQTAGPPTGIAVTVSPSSIVADGVSTTIATATVTDAQGHMVPGQPVAFSATDRNLFFGPVVVNPDGTYSAQVRGSRTVGQATIKATDGPLSATTILYQAAGPSTMSLTATPSTVVTNQSVTLVAVITPSTGSASGTVTFSSNGASIPGCVGVRLTGSATASCQTTFAAATSPERLTAVFTPDSNSTAPGAIGTAMAIVKQDSPWVSLAVAGSVHAGQGTTFSATVAPSASRPGPTSPSGWVAFFDNGQAIASCRSQSLVSGVARCSLGSEAVGQHTITALYGGDANFTGSGFPAQIMRVVPVTPPVLGIVSSTMQWSFYFTPRYTAIRAFSINSVSAAASVLVVCRGRGCPFRTHIASIHKAKRCGHRGRPKCPTSGTVDIAPSFANHRLGVGAKITIMISRPGWIGKYYGFVIQSSTGPRIRISCLAPGSTRPGALCST